MKEHKLTKKQMNQLQIEIRKIDRKIEGMTPFQAYFQAMLDISVKIKLNDKR